MALVTTSFLFLKHSITTFSHQTGSPVKLGNKKLLVTGASLQVTSALLLVTRTLRTGLLASLLGLLFFSHRLGSRADGCSAPRGSSVGRLRRARHRRKTEALRLMGPVKEARSKNRSSWGWCFTKRFKLLSGDLLLEVGHRVSLHLGSLTSM